MKQALIKFAEFKLTKYIIINNNKLIIKNLNKFKIFEFVYTKIKNKNKFNTNNKDFPL